MCISESLCVHVYVYRGTYTGQIKDLFLLFMCTSVCLYVCMCMYMGVPAQARKRWQISLELKSMGVVSHRMWLLGTGVKFSERVETQSCRVRGIHTPPVSPPPCKRYRHRDSQGILPRRLRLQPTGGNQWFSTVAWIFEQYLPAVNYFGFYHYYCNDSDRFFPLLKLN